jgi:hypothetical protein
MKLMCLIKLYDIDVDLSDLTNYIEETINSFFSIKCQYNNVNSNNVFVNHHNANPLFNQNLRIMYTLITTMLIHYLIKI